METILHEIQNLLVADEDAALDLLREHFFDRLELRRFADCRALLAILAAQPSLRFQQTAQRYHGTLLYYEGRQLDQAERIFHTLLEQLPSASPERARTLLNLAILLDEQGEWADAERMYQDALQAYQADQNTLGSAKVYNNLGISICYQVEQSNCGAERLDEALAHHQRAMDLATAAGNEQETAKNAHGLGKVYGLQQRFAEAEAAFGEYLEYAQDNAAVRGYTLTDLAKYVYLPQQRYAAAEAALNEAVSLLQTDHEALDLAEAFHCRGRFFEQQGNLQQALADYEAAIHCTEAIRTRLTAPTTKVSHRVTTEAIYSAPLTLHLKRGAALAAFHAAERARGRMLADLLSQQTEPTSGVLPAGLLQQRAELVEQLDQAYAAAADSQTLSALEKTLSTMDRQIELLDSAYAGLHTVQPLDGEEVQRRLPVDAVLLSYIADSDDQLWLMLVTPIKIEIRPVELRSGVPLTAQALHKQVQDYFYGSQRRYLVPSPTGQLLPPRPLFPPLYKALLAPVEADLLAAKRVYIIPFGPLYYLPIGALAPDLTREPPLLRAGRSVIYAPSATVLFNYCRQRPHSTQQGCLTVAPQDSKLRFIENIAATLTTNATDRAITGSAATRAELITQVSHYRLLCFLGHAHFDQRYPMASALQLADGRLRASEILRELRLQADLIILAACESGRSKTLRGDEILGLSRALLYAGTPSLLVTLWPVYEVPTGLLVQYFMRELTAQPDNDPAATLVKAQAWLRGLTYGEARQLISAWADHAASAADELLTELFQATQPSRSPQVQDRPFDHPFFWAAYVLIGDQAPPMT